MERLFIDISAIFKVLGMLSELLGHHGFDLESKIKMHNVNHDFMKSMLSLAWEHGF